MDAPLLVVVIMIKNEADAIVNTLLPFVQGGVTHMSVLDTGSTDDSIEITKIFFATHNITGFIDEEPFVDFSTSRNRALELAENHFPNAHFIIMVDADWYIQNVPRLLEFCAQEKSSSDPLYFINVKLGNLFYASPRIFRISAKNRYEGVVHEIPQLIPNKTVYNDVFFQHVITASNDKRSKARYTRDAELLERQLEKNPTNARALFYLGQTYECLSDLKNSYKYYQKRARVRGWIEEDVVCLYRLGNIAENLSQVDESITWATALDYYLKAFALRPIRIEPLVRIANYYLRENPYISYVYMRYACSVPYPKDDKLFVPQEMYDFTRYDILSVAAWFMGDFVTGKEATEMALRNQPNSEALKQKLVVYEAQIAKTMMSSQTMPQQILPLNNSLTFN